MNRLLLFLFTGLFFINSVTGQNQDNNILNQYCGTDEMHQELFIEHPGLNDKIIKNNETLNAFTRSFSVQKTERSLPYIIPVVFHIIHNFGTENISDTQIHDAIRVVNLNYRKLKPDTIEIVNAFKPIAADCEIELRLAQLDPNGNCTSGINRIASSLTYAGEHDVKSLIQWDPAKYLNVYVCAGAAGLAGHALLPGAADTVPQWDGIVIQHAYLGSIGTSSPYKSVVLSHEIGHYLNLQHTWGGNNVPGYYYLPVAQSSNCSFDDDVLDTPNTIGWTTCNLSGASCGNTIDNVQNFMDYAYCARMFTEGQKARMHAALNSPIASRNNLWTSTNLAATGTDGSNNFCAADFVSDKRVICAGQQIKFTDISYHGILSRTWTFSGGTPSTSNDTNVTVTYNTPGVYAVSLEVSDGTSSLIENRTSYVTVLSTPGSAAPISEGFESFSSIPQNEWFINNLHNDLSFELHSAIGATGSKSAWINNYSIIQSQQRDELLSPVYLLSDLTNMQVSFKYAFAQKDSANTDKLQVYFSNNCGDSWLLKKTITPANMATALQQTTPFTPTANQWETAFIMTMSGAQTNTPFRLKFVFESGGGNNFFIDDINIGYNLTYIEEKVESTRVSIFPNPNNGLIYLDVRGTVSKNYTLELYNTMGQLVLEKSFDAGSASFQKQLDIKHLANGLYFITLTAGNEIIKEKIVLNN